METRRKVEQGWRAVIQILENQGEQRLAESVRPFVAAMQPPRTEREALAEKLLERMKRVRTQKIEFTR